MRLQFTHITSTRINVTCTSNVAIFLRKTMVHGVLWKIPAPVAQLESLNIDQLILLYNR